MTAAEDVFLDTNVLLSAVTPSRRLHDAAVRALDGSAGRWHVSGQILREFLVVSTRPISVNGLGLDAGSALRNVDVIVARGRLLREDEQVVAQLRALVGEGATTGKQIHDASVVATMLAHGITTLVTGNPGHFDSRIESPYATSPVFDSKPARPHGSRRAPSRLESGDRFAE
jgi:predicted nucleic acid-binding protein